MRLFYVVITIACIVMTLTACERVSMPYVMKIDRVDQEMRIGNRGYLKGTPPPAEDRSSLKREFIAVDIDLVDAK